MCILLQIPQLEDQLLVSLLPKDEADERDVVLEVRPNAMHFHSSRHMACCGAVQILKAP